jgi:hypothetical protein
MSKKIALLSAIVYFNVCISILLAADLPYKQGELIVRFAPKADGQPRSRW